MKKLLIVLVVMATMALASLAHADAFYTCTVGRVGQSALVLTDTNGAFTDVAYALSSTAATRNQQLAIALTALGAGKTVYVRLASIAPASVIVAIYANP